MKDLLIIYLIICLGYFPTRGYFSYQGLFVLLVGFILLLLFYFKGKKEKEEEKEIIVVGKIVLTVLILLNLAFDSGLFSHDGILEFLEKVNYFICFFAVAFSFDFSFLGKGEVIKRNWKKILLILVFINKFLVIFSSPEPPIDVFYILKEAPKYLVAGENPYSVSFTKIYKNYESNYFAYWPGAFLVVAPFSVVFSDPRLLFIISDFFVFLIFKKLGIKYGELLGLLYLFTPFGLYLLENSWINPFNFFLIAALIYSLVKNKRKRLRPVIIGVLMSIQFHMGLFIPLYYKLTKRIKEILMGVGVTFLIVLPFLIWNFNDFYYDTVLTWVIKPSVVPIPYESALNINAVFINLFDWQLPNIFKIFGFGYVYLMIFLKMKKNVTSFLIGSSLVFFGLNLFGTQAFINYYYFVVSLILLGICTYSIPAENS